MRNFVLARLCAFAVVFLSGLSAQAAPALTADAGASPVAVDGRVSLLGTAWGGVPPYSYRWSVDGADVINPANSIAGLRVDNWDAGVYEAVLEIRDGSGATATDTVRFAVGDALTSERLFADAGGTYEFLAGAEQRLQGRIHGGRAPFSAGWDINLDGQIDAVGTEALTELPVGHHLVRFLVTDADGLESQQMTSVYVAGSKHELAEMAIPLTLIGMSDSGINPYHSEFSAATYPDPRVLELTQNFTRHPCEYITNYPCSAQAVPLTLGEGYYPEQDQALFKFGGLDFPFVNPGSLYWLPGTKIVGAIPRGYDSGADYIVDNNGHGTGSAGVAVGNRYGYCPTCLIFIVDDLSENDVYTQPFAELTSHSHGYVGNAPLGVLALQPVFSPHDSKAAVERGVTVLFSAGNGVGNAFTVTNETYGSDQNGPAWTVLVGAMRRDTSGSIVGEGTPAHISSWGDGWLPSACRTGTRSVCAHSGTSAASPYTAGVFGTVLRGVRQAIGDYHTGVREGQVIAEGLAIPGSPFLDDGKLTRREFRAVMLKTAAPLDSSRSVYPYPVNDPVSPNNFVFQGYGAATPNHAMRALDVLLGHAELPDRSDIDEFFAEDCEIRDQLYGSYDRDGDGSEDSCAKDVAVDPRFAGTGSVTNEAPFVPFAASSAAIDTEMPVLTEAMHFELHRTPAHEPWRSPEPCGMPQTATEEDHEQFMSQREDIEGDQEPCYDSRITSTVGAFRPKGIFHADVPLAGVLPAGSEVSGTIYVQTAAAGPIEIGAVLTANDRVIGRSTGYIGVTNPTGFTGIDFDFSTDRIAVAGEIIGVHFTLAGQTEWAYGFEGSHASNLTITPAAAKAGAQKFGLVFDSVEGTAVTGRVTVPDLGPDEELGNAGFAPVTVTVQVGLDADFSDAVWAAVDARSGTFSAQLPAEAATIYARAFRDGYASAVINSDDAAARGSKPTAELQPETVAPPVVAESRVIVPKGGSLGWLALLLLLPGLRRRA